MARWKPNESPPLDRQIIRSALIDTSCAKCGRTPGDWQKPDGTEIVLGDGYVLKLNALVRCHDCGNWAELIFD